MCDEPKGNPIEVYLTGDDLKKGLAMIAVPDGELSASSVGG